MVMRPRKGTNLDMQRHSTISSMPLMKVVLGNFPKLTITSCPSSSMTSSVYSYTGLSQRRRIHESLRLGDSIRGVLGTSSGVASHTAAACADEEVTTATEVYERVAGRGTEAIGSPGGIACAGEGRVQRCYEHFE
jgi:hypothetical protein